jgi:hypothetical protein
MRLPRSLAQVMKDSELSCFHTPLPKIKGNPGCVKSVWSTLGNVTIKRQVNLQWISKLLLVWNHPYNKSSVLEDIKDSTGVLLTYEAFLKATRTQNYDPHGAILQFIPRKLEMLLHNFWISSERFQLCKRERAFQEEGIASTEVLSYAWIEDQNAQNDFWTSICISSRQRDRREGWEVDVSQKWRHIQTPWSLYMKKLHWTAEPRVSSQNINDHMLTERILKESHRKWL